jgi:DNA-directed RNA polymerase specialized sigma24 family protein
MSAPAACVKSYLLTLVAGRLRGDPAPSRALNRLGARALRDARGGREVQPDEVEDLVQELLLKVLTLRAHRGAAALLAEWTAMGDERFSGYVRAMMRNLALDEDPVWDIQRALREVVRAALDGGLPVGAALPASVEKNGRFLRRDVAAACAHFVAQGVAEDVALLTSALMNHFALFVRACGEEEARNQPAPCTDAGVQLETSATAGLVVNTFMAEQGAEGRRLLTLRHLGFAKMGRELGVALATVHARYQKVMASLQSIARRLDADDETMTVALRQLSVV